jgi:hypothetical protein
MFFLVRSLFIEDGMPLRRYAKRKITGSVKKLAAI